MNKPTLYTSITTSQLQHYSLQNAIVVIIDVFRATSTIAAALYNGATKIIPVDSVTDAIEISKSINAIAAGERDGKLAEGMLHGNSPLEYNKEWISNKTLVLTTTNGTHLIEIAKNNQAEKIITGSFPNYTAVCDYLIAQKKHVVIACAGWKGRFNLEDTLFAGAIVHKIKPYFTNHCDSSLMAATLYQAHMNDMKTFAKQFTHYHRLVERLGVEDDIDYCLTLDIAPVLPIYINGALIAIKE